MKESQVLHRILWINKKNFFTNIIKNNDNYNNNNDDDDDDKVFQKMFLNISFKTYFQNRIMECKIGMKCQLKMFTSSRTQTQRKKFGQDILVQRPRILRETSPKSYNTWIPSKHGKLSVTKAV